MAFRGIMDNAIQVKSEQDRQEHARMMQERSIKAQKDAQLSSQVHQEKMAAEATARREKERAEDAEETLRKERVMQEETLRKETLEKERLEKEKTEAKQKYDNELWFKTEEYNRQTLEHQQLMEKRQMELDKYKQAWEIEQKQTAERQAREKELLQTSIAGMYMGAMAHDGVVPISAIEQANRDIGKDGNEPGSYVGGYTDNMGRMIWQIRSDQQDPQTKEFIPYEQPMDLATQLQLVTWRYGGADNPEAMAQAKIWADTVAKGYQGNGKVQAEIAKLNRQIELENVKHKHRLDEIAARGDAGSVKGTTKAGIDDTKTQLANIQNLMNIAKSADFTPEQQTKLQDSLGLLVDKLNQGVSEETMPTPQDMLRKKQEEIGGLIEQGRTQYAQYEEQMNKVKELDEKVKAGGTEEDKVALERAKLEAEKAAVTMNKINRELNAFERPKPEAFHNILESESKASQFHTPADDSEVVLVPKQTFRNAAGNVMSARIDMRGMSQATIKGEGGKEETINVPNLVIVYDDPKNNTQREVSIFRDAPDPKNKEATDLYNRFKIFNKLVGKEVMDHLMQVVSDELEKASIMSAAQEIKQKEIKALKREGAIYGKKEEERTGTLKGVTSRGGL